MAGTRARPGPAWPCPAGDGGVDRGPDPNPGLGRLGLGHWRRAMHMKKLDRVDAGLGLDVGCWV